MEQETPALLTAGLVPNEVDGVPLSPAVGLVSTAGMGTGPPNSPQQKLRQPQGQPYGQLSQPPQLQPQPPSMYPALGPSAANTSPRHTQSTHMSSVPTPPKPAQNTDIMSSELMLPSLDAVPRHSPPKPPPSPSAMVSTPLAATDAVTSLLPPAASNHYPPPEVAADSQAASAPLLSKGASPGLPSLTSTTTNLAAKKHSGSRSLSRAESPVAAAAKANGTSQTGGGSQKKEPTTPMPPAKPSIPFTSSELVAADQASFAAAAQRQSPAPDPRIIVHNDKSLDMEGYPEYCLGYYLYRPDQLLPNFEERLNGIFDVFVPAVYLSYQNPMIRKRSIHGTDVYTDDSDVVAMAIHSGKYTPPFNPRATLATPADLLGSMADHDLRVRIRVLPKLKRYSGSLRNRIKSRTWGDHDGVSFRVEEVTKLPLGAAKQKGRKHRKQVLAREYQIENWERHKPEFIKGEAVIFNKDRDPSYVYWRNTIGGKRDLGAADKTLSRFDCQVLYLENEHYRYEISQLPAGNGVFRLAAVNPTVDLSAEVKEAPPSRCGDAFSEQFSAALDTTPTAAMVEVNTEPLESGTEDPDGPMRKRKADEGCLDEDEQNGRRRRRPTADYTALVTRGLSIPLPDTAGVVDVIFPEFRWEDITWGNTGFILNELFFPVHKIFWRVVTTKNR